MVLQSLVGVWHFGHVPGYRSIMVSFKKKTLLVHEFSRGKRSERKHQELVGKTCLRRSVIGHGHIAEEGKMDQKLQSPVSSNYLETVRAGPPPKGSEGENNICKKKGAEGPSPRKDYDPFVCATNQGSFGEADAYLPPGSGSRGGEGPGTAYRSEESSKKKLWRKNVLLNQPKAA